VLRQWVGRSEYADQVSQIHNAFVQVVEHRPITRPINAIPDIVEPTVTRDAAARYSAPVIRTPLTTHPLVTAQVARPTMIPRGESLPEYHLRLPRSLRSTRPQPKGVVARVDVADGTAARAGRDLGPLVTDDRHPMSPRLQATESL